MQSRLTLGELTSLVTNNGRKSRLHIVINVYSSTGWLCGIDIFFTNMYFPVQSHCAALRTNIFFNRPRLLENLWKFNLGARKYIHT